VTPAEIRSLRLGLGLSQKALAGELGVTQPTISNWESGRTSPSREQEERLGEVLGRPAGAGAAPGTNYGEWFNAVRVAKGLTRPDLAAASGVSAIQVYNIETGWTENPRESTQKKLESALGIAAPEVVDAVEQEAEIGGLGALIDFDPHDETTIRTSWASMCFTTSATAPSTSARAETSASGSEGITLRSSGIGRRS
jgi:transcriptional regulator with XRE-family HTH domain